MRRKRADALPGGVVAREDSEDYFHGEKIDRYSVGRNIVVNIGSEWQITTITQGGRKERGILLLQVRDNGGHLHDLEFEQGPAPTVVEFPLPEPGDPNPFLEDSRKNSRVEIDPASIHITPDGRVEYNVREDKLNAAGAVIEQQRVNGVPQEFLVLYRKTLEIEQNLAQRLENLDNLMPEHKFEIQKKRLLVQQALAEAFLKLPDIAEMPTKDRKEISSLYKEIDSVHRRMDTALAEMEQLLAQGESFKKQHEEGKTEMARHLETEQEKNERVQFAKDYKKTVEGILNSEKKDLQRKIDDLRKQRARELEKEVDKQREAHEHKVDEYEEQRKQLNIAKIKAQEQALIQPHQKGQGGKAWDVRIESPGQFIPPTRLQQARETDYREEIQALEDKLSTCNDTVYDEIFQTLESQSADPKIHNPIAKALFEELERTRWAEAAAGKGNPDVIDVGTHKDFSNDGVINLAIHIDSPRAKKNQEILNDILNKWTEDKKLDRGREIDEKAVEFNFETETANLDKSLEEALGKVSNENGSPKFEYQAIYKTLAEEKRKCDEIKDNLASADKARKFQPFLDYLAGLRTPVTDPASIPHAEFQKHLRQFRMDELLKGWTALHTIGEEIIDRQEEESKQATAAEVKAEHINISSEYLRELLRPQMGNIREAVRGMFSTQLEIEMDSQGNPQVPESIIEQFRNLITEADLGEFNQEVLRRAGIKDNAEFKNFWDNRLAAEAAKNMFMMARQTLERELHERTGLFAKLNAVRQQVIARGLLTSATVALGSLSLGAAANYLSEVGELAKSGATTLREAAAVGGGALGGLAKWGIGKKLFGTKARQEEVTARLRGAVHGQAREQRMSLRDQVNEEFVNRMLNQMFGAVPPDATGMREQGQWWQFWRRGPRQSTEFAGGGLTVFSELLAHSMRSLRGEDIRKKMGEEEPEEAKAESLLGVDIVRYQEYLDRSERPIDKEDRKRIALVLQELRGRGSLAMAEIQKKGKSEPMQWVDKFLLEYSGQGTAKGAAATGFALSGLFLLNPWLRVAFGAALGGTMGYRFAERLRLDSERGIARRDVHARMERLRNAKRNYAGFDQAHREAFRELAHEDYLFLKRLIHGNALPEELSALVYFIQDVETDINGQPIKDEKTGQPKVTDIAKVDGQLIGMIENLVYELEEETNILFERPEDRGNLDAVLEELRELGIQVKEEWKLTTMQSLGRWARKNIAYRLGISAAGAVIGGGTFFVAGAAVRKIAGLLGLEMAPGGSEAKAAGAGAVATGVEHHHGAGAGPHVETAPEPRGADTEFAQAGGRGAETHLQQPIEETYIIKKGQGLLHAANAFQKDPDTLKDIIIGAKKGHPGWADLDNDDVIHKWRVEQAGKYGYHFDEKGETYTQTLHKGAEVKLVFDKNGYPELKIGEDHVTEHAPAFRPRVEVPAESTQAQTSALENSKLVEVKPLEKVTINGHEYLGQNYEIRTDAGEGAVQALYDPVTGQRVGIAVVDKIYPESGIKHMPGYIADKVDVKTAVSGVVGAEALRSGGGGGGGGGGGPRVEEAIKPPAAPQPEIEPQAPKGPVIEKSEAAFREMSDIQVNEKIVIDPNSSPEAKLDALQKMLKPGEKLTIDGQEFQLGKKGNIVFKGADGQLYYVDKNNINLIGKDMKLHHSITHASEAMPASPKETPPVVAPAEVHVSGAYESVAVTPATENDTHTLTLNSGKELKVSLNYMEAHRGEFVIDFTKYANANSGKDNFEALQKVMNGVKDYTLEYNPKAENPADKFRVKFKGDVVF